MNHKILTGDRPELRCISKKISPKNPIVPELIEEMIALMREKDGVGLAAPQVGECVRLIMIEFSSEDEDVFPLQIFINPIITFIGEKKIIGEEGCLSLPGWIGPVERFEKIHLEAVAPDDTTISRDISGFEAVVIQHEVDHLNGILFIDHIKDPTKLRKKKSE